MSDIWLNRFYFRSLPGLAKEAEFFAESLDNLADLASFGQASKECFDEEDQANWFASSGQTIDAMYKAVALAAQLSEALQAALQLMEEACGGFEDWARPLEEVTGPESDPPF